MSKNAAKNFAVIASRRVGAKRRPMTGSAKQSRATKEDWIVSLSLSSGAYSRAPLARNDGVNNAAAAEEWIPGSALCAAPE